MKVKVCVGSRCMLFGAMNIVEQLEGLQEIIKESPDLFIDEELEIEEIPCIGYCKTTQDKVSPVVIVGEDVLFRASSQEVMEAVMNGLSKEE